MMRRLAPVAVREDVTQFSSVMRAIVVTGGLCLGSVGHAALFEDEDARRAIIELRERVGAQQQALQKLQGEAVSGSSLLELSRQNDQLQRDLAQMRGRNEELLRSIDQVNKRLDGLSDRLAKLEPLTVMVDGAEIVVQPRERQAYDAAMGLLRQGEYSKSQLALERFIARYPDSGYRASALFWLGNAQYANQQFQAAAASFTSMASQFPRHSRVPEAKLALANCQLELKDLQAAKATLAALAEAHPESEAAKTAQQRLAALR